MRTLEIGVSEPAMHASYAERAGHLARVFPEVHQAETWGHLDGRPPETAG